MPMFDELNARVSAMEQRFNEMESGMTGAIEEMKTEKETLRTELSAVKDALPTNSIAKAEDKKVRLSTEPVEKLPMDETARRVFELASKYKQ